MSTNKCSNSLVGQNSIPKALGQDSNALVWPSGPPSDDAEEDELANYTNERFQRLGVHRPALILFILRYAS
jgi:hypothetical protein